MKSRRNSNYSVLSTISTSSKKKDFSYLGRTNWKDLEAEIINQSIKKKKTHKKSYAKRNSIAIFHQRSPSQKDMFQVSLYPEKSSRNSFQNSLTLENKEKGQKDIKKTLQLEPSTNLLKESNLNSRPPSRRKQLQTHHQNSKNSDHFQDKDRLINFLSNSLDNFELESKQNLKYIGILEQRLQEYTMKTLFHQRGRNSEAD